jgi:hypothetical protein
MPEEKLNMLRTTILEFQVSSNGDNLSLDKINITTPSIRSEINNSLIQINELLAEELSFKDKIAEIIRNTTISSIDKIEQIANILM